jgi:hypothetical protein
MMIGNVAGSPLAGAGLDLSGPVAAFAVIGCASALTAGAAFLADRRLGRLPTETRLTSPRVQP